MYLPLFPLQSIFFPGETVPLHIFEERYKQLIQDCRTEAITFGIPVFYNKTVQFGTEIQLVEVVNTYDSGAMDIIGVGRGIFKIITFDNKMPGKLYAGGTIEFLESDDDASNEKREEVLHLIKKLYDLMEVQFHDTPIEKFNSYYYSHKIGLSFEQEYSLLQLTRETERLQFLSKHLRNSIKVMEQINRTKARIEMNGHFKNFDPLDFEGFGK